MASGIVRGGDFSCAGVLKSLCSLRELMKFGGTLIARVMESDIELELCDNFCVKYVGAIDKIFSKKIRSMINLHCWSHCTGAWGGCLINQGYVIL